MGLDLERCCELVDREIARLAEVTDGVDPATPVPTCPEWTIADLLEHTGGVYRWAATMVRDAAPTRLAREEMDLGLPDDPAAYPAWIAAGAAFAVEQFRACDPGTPMWAWGWPKNAGFWPRRMVHEVGIHRADAELAVGLVPSFDAEVAADGVDELLDNLPQAAHFAPWVTELTGAGETMGWVAPDAGTAWTIELGPDEFRWARTPAVDPRCTVTAGAADLLLSLYRRSDAVTVTGDAAVWEHWIEHSKL